MPRTTAGGHFALIYDADISGTAQSRRLPYVDVMLLPYFVMGDAGTASACSYSW